MRDALLDELCYGLSQGIKLAESESPYKIGQHTEAMRLSILRVIKIDLTDEEKAELVARMKKAGYELDLGPRTGEGGSKP